MSPIPRPEHGLGPRSRREMSRPRRPSYRAARAFYLTFVVCACLAAYASFTQAPVETSHVGRHGVQRRDVLGTFQNAEEECRLVHESHDQCTFIKEHCPDEEAGFAAYLDLFYCKLAHVKPVAFIILVSWLGLLFSTIGIAASDFFCINLSTIAANLGMSESMAGVTFLAFGNGSPDVFSTFAAMNTHSGSLAVGELFGAAGFITAVVAGSMALIRPFHVARKSFVRDVTFFAVAAAFSIVFLWDGKLQFWECISMVAFYIFYVVFVLIWHWWLGRRRKRREREAAARGHFIGPGDEMETEPEQYHDDPDAGNRSTASTIRVGSLDAWSALERSVADGEMDEDDEEEARERWMSELSSNMRLTRPGRSRASTINAVRPSLVGALEFQAVLKALQKSRNIQTIPLISRRYTDDPAFTTAQQQQWMSSKSDPAARPPFEFAVTYAESSSAEQQRTDMSMSTPGLRSTTPTGNTSELRVDVDLQKRSRPAIRSLSIGESNLQRRTTRPRSSLEAVHAGKGALKGPSISETTPNPPDTTPQANLNVPQRPQSEYLAPPSPTGHFRENKDRLTLRVASRHDIEHSHDSTRTVPTVRTLPRIVIPTDRQSHPATPNVSPFLRYHDDGCAVSSGPPSLYLPQPLASPRLPAAGQSAHEVPSRLSKWWPYSVMPPPEVLVAALFPTIYQWREKNWWEKLLGLTAAPSVFLLTITLPVVENDGDKDDAEEHMHKSFTLNPARPKSIPGGASGQSADSPREHERESAAGDEHERDPTTAALNGLGIATPTADVIEQHQRHDFGESAPRMHSPLIAVDQYSISASSAPPELAEDALEPPELWNRWLTIIQLFLAPLFVLLSIYSQSPTGLSPKWLVRPTLICLLISCVLLIPLLATTTPTHRPAVYRTLLSLAGFVVSIAWISAIASEVVGALKALAVILNMSHAIMGLTIFAVGNSLGDLVADVTVAKLGYPVMALSACFGGPMLNILLGIGLSGSSILIRGAEHRHRKHPDKGIKFKSYEIEIGNTLLVSGATLLVTLLGLLIFVPLNNWVMSKRIGWALIILWTLSTVGNVVIELTGWSERGSEG